MKPYLVKPNYSWEEKTRAIIEDCKKEMAELHSRLLVIIAKKRELKTKILNLESLLDDNQNPKP